MSPYVAPHTFQPPRPLNSWVLYRRDKNNQLKLDGFKASNDFSLSSKMISEMWKNEPEAVKKEYKERADRLKVQHQLQYPDYKYKPRAKKTRGDGSYIISQQNPPHGAEVSSSNPTNYSPNAPLSGYLTMVPVVDLQSGQLSSQFSELSDMWLPDHHSYAMSTHPDVSTGAPSSPLPTGPVATPHGDRQYASVLNSTSYPSQGYPQNMWAQFQDNSIVQRPSPERFVKRPLLPVAGSEYQPCSPYAYSTGSHALQSPYRSVVSKGYHGPPDSSAADPSFQAATPPNNSSRRTIRNPNNFQALMNGRNSRWPPADPAILPSTGNMGPSVVDFGALPINEVCAVRENSTSEAAVIHCSGAISRQTPVETHLDPETLFSGTEMADEDWDGFYQELSDAFSPSSDGRELVW